MRSKAFFFIVLLALVCTFIHPSASLRLKPTTSSLTFEVGDDEVCMYSFPLDFFEGVSMHYHVLQGGIDFDVFIRNPDNKTIYASFAGEHGLEDRVYFTTHSKWEHSYCINNRGYSKELKVIKMELGLTSLKRWKNRIDPLQKLMKKTEGYILGMHDDQLILRLREQSLRAGIENMFTLMTIRGVTETIVVVVVSVVNALLIAHLFHAKKRNA